MPTPIVILDTGHGQKPDRAFDPGVTKGALREVDLAGAYLDHAAEVLRARGWNVHRMSTGAYSARHAEAVRLVGSDRAIYVQGHVNAGGGRYALVEHDSRSTAGAKAAAMLAHALTSLHGVSVGKVAGLADGERGFTCIRGIWTAPRMCGLIYEPGFLDNAEHDRMWTPAGLMEVGVALADGLTACWRG